MMELCSSFLTLYIANDQSWKNPWQKRWELAPWWSVWNVFFFGIQRNWWLLVSSRITFFLVFYNLITVIVKQFNIFCETCLELLVLIMLFYPLWLCLYEVKPFSINVRAEAFVRRFENIFSSRKFTLNF